MQEVEPRMNERIRKERQSQNIPNELLPVYMILYSFNIVYYNFVTVFENVYLGFISLNDTTTICFLGLFVK